MAKSCRVCWHEAILGVIDMPITREIVALLFESKSPASVTESRMQHAPRGE